MLQNLLRNTAIQLYYKYFTEINNRREHREIAEIKKDSILRKRDEIFVYELGT